MIRITQTQLQRASLNAVGSARSRLFEAQQVALTGLRVSRPSDDPAAATRARIIDSLTTASEAQAQNIDFGVSRLQSAESALGEIDNLLLRVKEIVLQMSNDSLNGEQRAAASTEVNEIRQSVISLMNMQHLGEHVFAPIDTDTPVYDDAASSFTFDVNVFVGVRRVEVGPGQLAEIGSSASMAFAARAADPGSVDLPSVLADVVANLTANDTDAIRADIDIVQRGFDQVLAERSKTGVRVQRLRTAEVAAQQASTVYTTLRGDLVDADAATAFSELSLAETTMQAAVTVAARILGPSLLDAF